MLTFLALLTCVGAGLIGGVFFAFSSFLMKALAQLPVSHGVAAMQRINVVVLNPFFLAVFLGTAVLAAACVVAAAVDWRAPRSILLSGAGLLYFFGTFVITVGFNLPRNRQLAVFDSESPQATAYWPIYMREWTRWNHIRTVAAFASAACAAAAIST